ncbi:NUDIX domain-containing protein [Salinicoccus sp. ID82-1]|uniref:NUDIX domain-containing protein n=1 Tax=Salinicoccus cyprini TaxID=2493691 RepID=A0A558AZU7_9STAP|nr:MULTISPECIES: NUDIX domain-containing protein [Salinicoccus]MCG1009408.1 NUDIX domain-containing protein [Salinicoccus sp. ID82-1]TVT29780.1 NUDIX domain-containing protein [Salinicoccus cyprini]
MLRFKDHKGRKVTLELGSDAPPGHILCICRMDGKYLLTDHRTRGIEFPGGKIEAGESPEEALHREVFEETGASLDAVKYIGAYTVHDAKPFVKAVFFAEVKDIFFICEYSETHGPVIYRTIEEIPEDRRSFLLDDACIDYLYQMSRNDEFFK